MVKLSPDSSSRSSMSRLMACWGRPVRIGCRTELKMTHSGPTGLLNHVEAHFPFLWVKSRADMIDGIHPLQRPEGIIGNGGIADHHVMRPKVQRPRAGPVAGAHGADMKTCTAQPRDDRVRLIAKAGSDQHSLSCL